MNNIKINYSTTESLWSKFLHKNPNNNIKEIPLSFYFCDNKEDADECAELVVKSIKQATAPSLWSFENNNEPLPKIGNQFIVTDWDGNAKAIIEVTKIKKTPYNKISPEFAKSEGEGDKSLSYWKRVHKAYYSREVEPFNKTFDENMIIVCVYFKTVFLN